MSKIAKISLVLIVGLVLILVYGLSTGSTEENCESLFHKDNYELTIKVCTEEAENGIAVSQNLLGVTYFSGWGVSIDYIKAKEWYQLAAAQGHSKAQNNLGYMYQYGAGVPQDYVKSKEWYQLAANQNEPTAQYNLAIMYEDGLGVPQDYARAKEWYKKNCDNGDNDGCMAYQALIDK